MNVDRLFATPLTRRQLTTAIGLTAANLALSSCTKSFRQEPASEQISGGEIITTKHDFRELIEENITHNEPLTPDPTIIKSAIYHGRLFNGDSKEVAELATRHVFLNKEPLDSPMATQLSPNGVHEMYISPDYYTGTSTSESAWMRYIRVLLHETGHM